MKRARRRLGVASDSSARPMGSIAEKKIPEMPRNQASMSKSVAKAAHSESDPKPSRHSPRTGLRPILSASGGMMNAPIAMPIC